MPTTTARPPKPQTTARRASGPRTRKLAEVASTPAPQPLFAAAPVPRVPMSLEEFQARDWATGDGLKWEWCDGFAEAGEESMQVKDRMIAVRMLRAFRESPYVKSGAELLQETDCFLQAAGTTRRPDMAAFTNDELIQSEAGHDATPRFVIEILSKNDNHRHVMKKLDEYFASGVLVVWHVDPATQRVSVYRSPKEVTICEGSDVCSAAPAFAEFQIAAEKIFG
ncbi:MAG: Uma2 family endonuclease [Roseimicrobium sp.]